MRKSNAKFVTAFTAENGKYLGNNGHFAFLELDNYACYVIADGIDDDLGLGSAKTAVACIIRQFSENPGMRARDITNWLEKANKELLVISSAARLKASLTVMVTDYSSMMFGMAGNTRLYLYRAGALIHRSIDQSLSSNMQGQGRRPADNFASQFERHKVYCCLGQPIGFCPEISGPVKLLDGDRVILLNKAVWDNIDVAEIASAIDSAKEPKTMLNRVDELLMMRKAACRGNYTLASVFIDKTYEDIHKALNKRLLYTAIPAILIIIGLLLFTHVSGQKREAKIVELTQHSAMGRTLFEQGDYSRATEEYNEALKVARKLNMKNEQAQLTNFCTAAELIVAGDTAFQEKNYALAAERYSAALDATCLADGLGEAYLLKQWRLARDYLEVDELIRVGDQQVERQDFLGALKSYLEAKAIASSMYYHEGRKTAIEKLSQIKGHTNAHRAYLLEADIYERQADIMVQRADYQSALAMMIVSSGLYEQGGRYGKAMAVQRKTALLKDKIKIAEKTTEQDNIAEVAAQYVKEGDRLVAEKDIGGALDQYNLALSLYEKSDKKEKIALMQMKIDNFSERNQDSQ